MTALARAPLASEAPTHVRLLAKIATIPPSAWDAIVPRGRVHPAALERLAEAMTRRPGTLPAHESVVGARLLQGLVGPGALVRDGGEAEGHALVDDVEDWCATGWPPRWTAPGPSTRYDRSMVFAGGAVAAAHLAGSEGRLRCLRGSLELASNLLAEAAVGA